ncbi:MFS transporter [Limosilactobacillus sp. STM2_1]|uniref:MFS transporter n=1 Tax=Limosilactobacillus rudii TaxID=2759755 RepID=A0A7W3ULL2_9LACO|nr:MFS transporter [Limosilactobacillus rudii]MBB1079747.1 MFS transporter [Limosilactobacillus rudii]MBB1097793.1 MFS transporter [Limosilactobacillus rudii]MCD7134874.1 MFS transporter [Limosilactobacillus rudii]
MKSKNTLIICAMSIGIFLCMLDTTVMNVALPAIQSSLNAQLNSLSWALNIYTILFASLTIPLGKIAERFGINRTYIIGLVVFICGSTISASAHNLNILIIGRALQSIGAALVFPLSMTIGISIVDISARKKVIAILGITQGLAAALGPTIGGCLTQFLSWRWIFIINIPLSIISVIICLLTLELHETTQKESIDFLGSFLSMVTLFCFTLSLVQGRVWGWHSSIILSLLTISGISLLVFIVCEHRSTHPMVPLILFHNREFTGSAIAILLSNLFLVAVTVVLPTYFVKIQGKTELTAALLITPITGMIFIFSPLAAFIIDKLGARMVIATGFILMTISFILLATINMENLILVIITCLILGTGYGIIAGPITVLAASNFKGSLLNASQSVAGVLRQIGISLAIAIYVTGLYGNLVIAKNNSTHYIKEEVATLNIPQSKKNTVIQKAINSLSGNSTSTPKTHFSQAERESIIQENYNKVLTKQPTSISEVAKQQIYIQVKSKVNLKLKAINKNINATITKIKSFSINEYGKAFTKLYSYSIIFVLLSIFTCLLFPRKVKNN